MITNSPLPLADLKKLMQKEAKAELAKERSHVRVRTRYSSILEEYDDELERELDDLFLDDSWYYGD